MTFLERRGQGHSKVKSAIIINFHKYILKGEAYIIKSEKTFSIIFSSSFAINSRK